MGKKGKKDEQPAEDIDLQKPISQAAYARARGVTRQFIGSLVKDEKIKLHNGKVIPAEADQARADNADPSKEHLQKKHRPNNGKIGSGSSGGESGDDYNDQKVIDSLKKEFSPDEIKILERAIQKVPTWNTGNRVLATIKAANELLIYQRERGMLVDAKITQGFWIDQVSMVKAKLLTLPKKMVNRVASHILKYAAKMGGALVKHAAAIKKKGKGPGWLHDKKTDDLVLLTGKGKKAFIRIPLSLEAPEHAEALALTEIEQALAAEVSDALNELVTEGKEKG